MNYYLVFRFAALTMLPPILSLDDTEMDTCTLQPAQFRLATMVRHIPGSKADTCEKVF